MYIWEKNINWDALKKQKTLDIDKAFYTICASPKIREKFSKYESYIAVGLAGEGSECFGFDDMISRDHDFELGFCMWLTKDIFEEIGSELQNFYTDLMEHEGRIFSEKVFGEDASFSKDRVAGRRGVMEISQFYGRILRMDASPDTLIGQKYWIYAEPRFLAAATNGDVFRDDEGVFSAVRREILNYYPDNTLCLKIAEQLHLFSHGGQSNYPRMMARKDYIAARLCIDQTISSAMQLAYLLNRKYPPYYKWTGRGLADLSVLSGLSSLLKELVLLPVQTDAWEDYTYSSIKVNTRDAVINIIEDIAALLADELKRQGFIDNNQVFLESHVQTLVAKAGL